jgi:hypothetical protein
MIRQKTKQKRKKKQNRKKKKNPNTRLRNNRISVFGLSSGITSLASSSRIGI